MSSAATTDATQLEKLREWRASVFLSSAEAVFLSDETLVRYLRARGSVGAATDALRRTLLWRAEHCREAPACPACERDPGTHCFLGVGWTNAGLPVVYGSVPRAADYEPAGAVSHFAQTLEKIFSHAHSGPRFVWLFDLAGYTLRHAMLIRAALGYATTFSRHYPERLEAVVLLNPPPVWDVALSLVRPFLDARTLAKVRPVHARAPEALAAALTALELGLSADTIDWVAAVQRTAPVPRTLPLPLPPGAEGLRLAELGSAPATADAWVAASVG